MALATSRLVSMPLWAPRPCQENWATTQSPTSATTSLRTDAHFRPIRREAFVLCDHGRSPDPRTLLGPALGCGGRDVRVEQLREASHVAGFEPPEGLEDDLYVLLRHRPRSIPRRGIVVLASPSSRVLAGLVSASDHAPHHHPAGHGASRRGDERPGAGPDHYEKDRERREDSTKPHVRVIHRFSFQDLQTRLGPACSVRIGSAHWSCRDCKRGEGPA